MRNYVIINGVNSLTIQGLAINNLPPITKPMIRTQREEIDGRDGDIVTELGYSAYDKSMEIGLYGNFDIDEIIKFFTGEGTIVFSNEEDKYYNFKILDQIDYEKLLKFKTAVITFHCQPFKYPVEETPIEGEAITITGSGSNITLENTIVAPMEMKVKGNTIQDGTPTPDSPVPVQVVSGDNSIEVSTNINNKGIRLGLYQIANGEYASPTSGNRYATFNDLLEVQPNTTYKVTTTNNINAQFYQLQYNESKTYLSNSSSAQSVKDYTFTTGATTKYLAIDIRAYDSTNITTDYVGGIEVIDTKASYPISLGVENLLNANVNKETISGVTFTPIYNDDSTLAYIVANGTATAGFNYYVYGTSSAYYSIPAGTYYLSDSAESGESNTTYFTYLDIENEPNLYLSTIATKTRTYSTSANIRVRIVVRSGAVLNNVKFYPMLEKGNTQSSYTPYGKALELCKIGTYQDKIDKSSGKNLLDMNNLLVGIYTPSATPTISGSGDVYKSFNLTLKKGTYSLYSSSSIYAVRDFSSYDYSSQVTLGSFPANTKSTFTITQDATVYFSFRKYDNTAWDSTKDKVWLVEGSDTIEYEPYGTGWYLKKEIGKVVLNGSENWEANWNSTTNTNGFVYRSFPSASGFSSTPAGCMYFSNHFHFSSSNRYDSDNELLYINTSNASGMKVSKTTAPDLATFKTWLGNNNVEVYYVLSTPTYEYITDTTLIGQLEALKPYSYNPTTNITQTNNDAPFELDVSLSYTNTMNVNNVGNIYAKPILTIEGSGTIGIILNDIEVLSVDLGTDEKITIDVPNLQAYNPDNDVLLNRNVTGDYMKLLINDGDNTIAFSGSVTSATLTNYTRYI